MKNVILFVLILGILSISVTGALLNYKGTNIDTRQNPWTRERDFYTLSNQSGNNITADFFFGDGSELTGVAAATSNGTGGGLWTNETPNSQVQLKTGTNNSINLTDGILYLQTILGQENATLFIGSFENMVKQIVVENLNVTNLGAASPNINLFADIIGFNRTITAQFYNGSGKYLTDINESILAQLAEFADFANNTNISNLLTDLTNENITMLSLNVTNDLIALGQITFSNLTSCDTIDTDANGLLSCGTDDIGFINGSHIETGFINNTGDLHVKGNISDDEGNISMYFEGNNIVICMGC